ncbi:hypothetical protein Pfo_030980 [Paulownia fortunei]|nr:hypothetical protein Pfo_030980 [Paulownia fortunei]
MAYAALVSLAQTTDQYPISLPGKQEIKSIHDQAIFLQAFLEKFPEKANSLEGRITDVANKAEDIIDYFALEKNRLHCGLIESTVGPSKVKFKRQLRKVAEKIKTIAGEVKDIKNSVRIENEQPTGSPAASSSLRHAPTGKNDMVGFNDDLLAIKDQLCGEPPKLQVIPISGMGGIGKTTFARNAYDDALRMQHFDIYAWVTVSQDYSTEGILSGILVSMKGFKVENSGHSNEENVYKTLKRRRYLIVMDDMWSTKVWDDVKMIFPDDHNGSRIMLTTRLFYVAAYPDSSSPLYEMRFMDEDQSWNLLRRKVFTHEDCPPELENIGKTIARSCRGLPLAIVLIAGLLSTVNKTRASWKEIAEHVNSTVATKDGQFEKILSLSYTHLTHHLRPCFLYMGCFPEDYEIHVSKLIKLWVAEGFLKTDGSKSFEVGAEEYLDELVKRSLIFVNRRKLDGKIKSCSLHDLVRDLCIRKAGEEKFLLHVMDRYVGEVLPETIKNQRRISIAYSNLKFLANINGSTIRTIICVQRRRGSSLGSLGNFRLLRVLDVVNANVSSFPPQLFVSLPAQIFELFHLRYLAFYNHVKIPAAISNLQNLQTIIIHPGKTSRMYIPCLVRLPMEIWRMPRLRHLVSSYFDLLPNPEGSTFALENLQTLSVATEFKCTERVLKMIPNLKKLGIYYFGNKDGQEYHLENLVYLHQLETLNIEIFRSFPSGQKIYPVFPTTLKKLTLSGCLLPWKDMTTVGSLPNLQVLKLRNFACHGGKWETTEGEFPQLQFLLIHKSDLWHWITERSHFPSLKCLLLHHCWHLREIPDGIGEVPTLELIEVNDGNKSLVDSAKRIQEEQQTYVYWLREIVSTVIKIIKCL